MTGSPPASPGPRLPVLEDASGRQVRYLRISLTDRCNYRCTYCMPAEGVELLPKKQVLTFEEIERLVRVLSGVGLRRVRLTGGEPTIRKNLPDLVSALAAVPGIDEVVMTTNAHRMALLAEPLARAGLASINVSVDTLDADKFRDITRRGDLSKVIEGIDASLAAGIGVKLNAVALRDFSEPEIVPLCEFAWQRGTTVRFIEHMPMSEGLVYTQGAHLSAQAIRDRIATHFGADVLPSQGAGTAVGPARYFALSGDPGRRFGIISAMSEHFCDTCNRVRLSSIGELHTCLGYDDATDLRTPLRSGATDDDILAMVRLALAAKRDGHQFEISGIGGPRKHMVTIGG